MSSRFPVATPLLAWYYKNRRILPFREDPTPYHIWVSEIMLQQTRVAAALPYYTRFIQELPDVAALAVCEEQRLHKLWEGLGYYSRVRNMQKAAQLVVEQFGGQLPASFEELHSLPGIGDYTAGAIASIAFGLPTVAVDGNVLRVFSRLLADARDVAKPETKKALALEVQRQQPADKAGDYNQALMELGALVCVPGNPQCEGCPLAQLCEGYKQGIQARLPQKAAKKPKQNIDICVLIVKSENKVLMQKRPAKGLLAGLWQPLLWEGQFTKGQAERGLLGLIQPGEILQALPLAKHVFTHKVWNMYGWVCKAPKGCMPPDGYVFVEPELLASLYPVPSAFRAYLPFLMREG